jgi:catechol-2,3-dioxygenase
MLGNSRVHPVLLSTDLAQASEFYHDKVGLEILEESEDGIVFQCGGGTKVVVTMARPGLPTARPSFAGRSRTFPQSLTSCGPAG